MKTVNKENRYLHTNIEILVFLTQNLNCFLDNQIYFKMNFDYIFEYFAV